MPHYAYKVVDRSGTVIEGTMEGRDRRAVIDHLQSMDYLPIQVTESTAEEATERGLDVRQLLHRVTRRDGLSFTQQMATLFTAGLEIDRALQIIIPLTKKARMREVVEDLLARVQEGSTFSDALGRHPRIFNNLYTGMVHAGEAGGALGPLLQRLAAFLESVHATRAQIISQLIYPAILTVAGGAAVVVLLVFVVPRFTDIFADLGQALPLPTQILLAVSGFVQRFWWALLAGIVVAWVVFRRLIRRAEGRRRWDRFKLRLPLVGELIQKAEVGRFARTLGTLLTSGVPILQAMSIVQETVTNRVFADLVGDLTEAVRAGRPLALPLRASRSFPPLATQMIAVGEESGRLEEMLLHVADIFDADVQTTVRRLTAIVEPVIILVLGIVVGFIVVSILLAIFSITAVPL
ncbi:MAG: type II secretion system F family protein [Candidatus Tectimicrobiota bacterium]